MSAFKECDIIMKGGITSGMVYPKAIKTLSESYIFRCIGGTSAGAVVAVVTAAAEYGRHSGGYQRLDDVTAALRTNLIDLFQPDPRARRLFDVFKAVLDKKYGTMLLRIALLGLPWTVLGIALGLIPPVLIGGIGAWLMGLVGAFFLGIVFAIVATVVTLRRLLPQLDYGLCPGSRVESREKPAFPPLSDWLTDAIDTIAGLDKTKRGPLLIRDLKVGGPGGLNGDLLHPAIDLRTVTTNLNMRRPYTLPNMGDRNYYFKASEFRRLFPQRVVDQMVSASLDGDDGQRSDGGEILIPFPRADDLPVVVTARMSLSFPFLIAAVPLYRIDHTIPSKPIQRLLFSDGGLSSNFPIHFFDSLFPTRPTFGISLDEFSEYKPTRRVYLPMPARDGQEISMGQIPGVAAFVMALVNAAKDWQDQLRTVLPGYRERVAHVFLKSDEGGLNLNMPPERIDTLLDLGERAGHLMAASSATERGIASTTTQDKDRYPFDFDDHRWRRFLTAYMTLEEALLEASASWGEDDAEGTFRHFIKDYLKDPASYGGSSLANRQKVFDRVDALMTLVRGWNPPLRDPKNRLSPKPDGLLRITPRY
ncbi:patatin-like phospholipase domain-containing protein [Magnetospirillum molischianum]|uniref:Putative RpoH suppressor n=1 Tax=Magnetospirillum molischianum DSM 120 TaxID=1150626 RepID=H8FTG9_MAGML|nr:patatin-like phospholipase family protein [Magnetospirillum molischianum]CCG41657.1 putative RpoH suppressor [Magnetospirillum molischianum DSM 120]